MTALLMRWISRAVVRYPVLVLLVVGAITAVLYSHIHYLRMGTDLTEMFGRDDPQWRVVSQLGRELGYGNQLFVLVEAGGGEDSSGPMEEFADRLTAGMNGSGLFKYARSGLQDEELLQIVRLHVWNFPSYTLPGERDDIRGRLTPESIRRTFRKASTEMVTPFRRWARTISWRIRWASWNRWRGAARVSVSSPISISTGGAETGSSAKTTGRCSSLRNRARAPSTISSPRR